MKPALRKHLSLGIYSLIILKKRLANLFSTNDNCNKLDYYEKRAPAPQTALDIFNNEWISEFPNELGAQDQSGDVTVFQDPKVEWFIETIGGLQGKNILELGPLEAAHTYMLERSGAKSIVAVEANTRAFLKCLIMKELLDLNKSNFLCGNFIEYLRMNNARFDVILASGILYHMANPAEVIELCANATDTLFIWTHYYDEEIVNSNDTLSHLLDTGHPADQSGFKHTLYKFKYVSHLFTNNKFIGGTAKTSSWMTKNDLKACLEHFGFNAIEINFDQPNAPSGPCLALTARKQKE